jgi:hypothetical protein
MMPRQGFYSITQAKFVLLKQEHHLYFFFSEHVGKLVDAREREKYFISAAGKRFLSKVLSNK